MCQSEDYTVFEEGCTVLFEPPKKINMSFYRCDNKFHLDQIVEMYDDENLIGVCLMSGEELRVYTVSITGSHIEQKLLKHLDIKLPNKQKKGGQSAVRFARNADIARQQYVIKYAECIVNTYMTDNNTKCNVTKIIVAGFGFMPDDVIETQLFQQYLKKYLFKKMTISQFDNLTATKIVKECQVDMSDFLAKQVNSEIQMLINRSDTDLLAFGKFACIECIENSNISKLYVNVNQIDQNVRDIFVKFPNIKIIETTSSELELYGGWLCVKKYLNEYN